MAITQENPDLIGGLEDKKHIISSTYLFGLTLGIS